MSLKSLIPGTAAHSERHFKKYMKRLVRGHDVLLQVKWADGLITHLPADFEPESQTYRATNGLPFKMAGKGAEPGQIAGVPVVRCLATMSCPFDATASVALNMEDAGRFTTETDEAGKTAKAIQLEATPDAPEGDAPAGAAATDGGQVAHEFDMKPPNGCVGWAYSLDTAAEYAPYAVSPQDIKDAEERGKQSERLEEGTSDLLKGILIGGAMVFLVAAVFVFIMNGGGGGGGASSTSGGNPILPTIQFVEFAATAYFPGVF
jgi:hypothetical protein